MAGRKHETKPEQETVRKGQISDGSGKNEYTKPTENFECSLDTKYKSPSEQFENLKIEEPNKIDVHFYTLSIMNEANKVIFLLYYIYFYLFHSYRYVFGATRSVCIVKYLFTLLL